MEAKLVDLLAGTLSRERVAAWALQWVAADDPAIENDVVWDALGWLAGADLDGGDSPYLYGPEDFRTWLADFRRQIAQAA